MWKTATLTLATLLATTACTAPGTTRPASSAPASAPAPSTAAGGASATATSPGTVIDRLGLANADAVKLIDSLDRASEQRSLDVSASVRADKVVLKADGGERTLSLPADKFYLSVAPYVTKTHDCFAHSLSGCQGEQVNKPMHIKIVDANKATLVDQDVITYTNGFVGFWLPRNVEGTVTATMDGKTGTVPFATRDDSPTCLTTLQLR